MIQPQSLADIYARRQYTKYRVRDVETLEDYCVFLNLTFNLRGELDWCLAMRLDFYGLQQKLNAQIPKYVLLSSSLELTYLSGLQNTSFTDALAKAYRLTSYQFGEG